jgi:hypothetical protein
LKGGVFPSLSALVSNCNQHGPRNVIGKNTSSAERLRSTLRDTVAESYPLETTVTVFEHPI